MNNRGVILLSVLWVVLVLSVISLSLAAAVRTEMSSSRGGFDSERAFFMARGAAEVMFQDLTMDGDLFAGSPVELVNGEYVFPFDTGEVRVRLESGRGRIDINQASDMLLASMFDSLGVDQDTRNRLVDSILDWRDGDDIPHLYGAEIADYDAGDGRRLPANGVFRFVDDILFVKGMTPEFFYGRLVLDTTSGGFRRVPGVRELVTTESGTAQVNPNETSADVLRALPGIEAILARAIVEARGDRFFDDLADLVGRVPALSGSDVLGYFTFERDGPVTIASRAQVLPSGVSRTVRLILRREERLQILRLNPPVYRRVQELKLDRWQYE